MNPTLIAGGIGLAASLSLGFMWQMEKVKSATFEGQVTTLNAQMEQQLSENTKLTTALSAANNSTQKAIELANKNNQRMNQYSDKLEQSTDELANLRQQVNEMRTKEMKNAIEAPYQRGNAAANRWTAIMQRIANETDSNSQSDHSTNATAGDSTAKGKTSQGN
jgi:septal ring factor EnvC (AmiA/AmiB activator)